MNLDQQRVNLGNEEAVVECYLRHLRAYCPRINIKGQKMRPAPAVYYETPNGSQGHILISFLVRSAREKGEPALRRQAAIAASGLLQKKLEQIDPEIFDNSMERLEKRLETFKENMPKEELEAQLPHKPRELDEQFKPLESEIKIGTAEQGAPKKED